MKGFLTKFNVFQFWLGAADPQSPQSLSLPQNGLPWHLIEAAKWGHLDQMLCFRRRWRSAK